MNFSRFVPALLVVLTGLTGTIIHAQETAGVPSLLGGSTVRRELKGGDTHSYNVELKAGQFLNVVVEQKGIDVVLTLVDSTGKSLAEIDGPNGTQGPEELPFVVETGGGYNLRVASIDKTAVAGQYELQITALRSVEPADKIKVEAARTYAEATAERSKQTAPAFSAAAIKYEKAATQYRDARDSRGEATAINEAGVVYAGLDQNEKAVAAFQRTLPIFKEIGDKQGEATTLNNLGVMLSILGDLDKAIEHYSAALPLLRAMGNKADEANALTNIGICYSKMSQYRKALDYYEQALPIVRSSGSRAIEAFTLGSIGFVYNQLGELQVALKYFVSALDIRRKIGPKADEAIMLGNVGTVYSRLGERSRALDHFDQALKIYEAVGDLDGVATMHNNLGSAFGHGGEFQKAVDHRIKALAIYRELGDISGEAYSLNNLGNAYSLQKDYVRARQHFTEALPLLAVVGDKQAMAAEYYNFFTLNNAAGNPRAAAFFGKLAVNRYQRLRSGLSGLDKNVQRAFLKSIEGPYRRLASTLIADGRPAEAQQVLNLFKDQQFFDFRVDAVAQESVLTERESEHAAALERHVTAVGSALRKLNEVRRSVARRSPTDAEAHALRQLETELRAANERLKIFLSAAEANLRRAPGAALGEVPDVDAMQSVLKRNSEATGKKTAAVYTLLIDDHYRALVVTENQVVSVSVPIKDQQLNTKAQQLWSLLRTPRYDPRPLANELYKIVFAPIESKLPVGTKTILWSLDGNLRYVPMAALHDGRRYLAERYENVVFTRADTERLTRGVSQTRAGIGMGSSEAHNVELLGSKFNASALPSVRLELGRIFGGRASNGILAGGVLLNSKFTKAAMLTELKASRPLVHIASHFRFEPGDEARSFLLLGDGTPFTLDEMKAQPNLFSGVDLLTLSACETAAQKADANGREVDGFAELAQRLGASSVMASLWEVSDNSTAELMGRFYRSYGNGAGRGKADALRRAQLALLTGAYNPGPSGSRRRQLERATATDSSLDRASLRPFKVNRAAPYAHPYYWSPFILIGNWR